VSATGTRALAELRRADEPRFGAKSASLGELIGAGVTVPPGFALSAEAYLAAVEGIELRGRNADQCAAAIGAAPIPA
jgi:pyruvate,water dikinase